MKEKLTVKELEPELLSLDAPNATTTDVEVSEADRGTIAAVLAGEVRKRAEQGEADLL